LSELLLGEDEHSDKDDILRVFEVQGIADNVVCGFIALSVGTSETEILGDTRVFSC
jgi:hypothetical protein